MYCGQTIRRKKLVIPLDRAIKTTYKLLKVTMSPSAAFSAFLAAILNAMLLPTAVTYVRQITVSYPSTDFSVQYSNVTRSCMGLHSLCHALSATRSRALAFRYGRYGRPIAATTGIFVLQEACCIHVCLQV